jgi:hypothetical protein
MKNTFRRCEQIVLINGEEFCLNDVQSVVSDYKQDCQNHYYDGRKHYKSDGLVQVSCKCPDQVIENVFQNIVGIRLVKKQREIDEKHIEHLRNKRR